MELNKFKCNFIHPNQIEKEANNLILIYKLKPPIDVELLIEKLGIQIIELNLPKDIDAFINSKADKIIVNLQTFLNDRYINRVRFSLAHELGHFILHKKLLHQMDYNNIEEYLNFMTDVDPLQYKYFEIQANKFAGRLLVPNNELYNTIKDLLYDEAFKDDYRLLGTDILCMPTLINKLSQKFIVSDETIEYRINDEKTRWDI